MLSALLLSSLLLLLLHKTLLVPLFFSPLRHASPAHWTCRFTPLWILWRRFCFRENATVLAAHRRHGPVVLLAPNELSVNCVDDGLRTIYAGGFEKHDVYPNLFGNYGVPVMFSTAESGPHSIRKRMMSNIYSKSSVQSSPNFAAACDHIIRGRLLSRIASNGVKPQDARRLLESTTMDVVTAYLFGLQNASDFLENPDEAAKWITLYQSRREHVFWPQELFGISSFFARLGIHLSPTWVAAANEYLEAWCLRLCDAAEAHMGSSGHGSDATHDHPAVYAQLRSQMNKGPEGDPLRQRNPSVPARIHVASEMLDHLSAGHETSAITLTFFFHELSLRPGFQMRLRAELAELPPCPTAKQLDALPLLQAALLETLRLHSAIPGPQPRVTPYSPGGVTLGNITGIPGGVRVSASAYALHRNSAVFAEPSSWKPERWLPDTQVEPEGDAERLRAQHRWFWAFSSGGRMCIGRHLAMAQMKAIVAAAVRQFDLVRVTRTKEGMGEPLELERLFVQEDAYTAHPIDSELLLRFVPAPSPEPQRT